MAKANTLTEQYQENLANAPRCKPQCYPRDWLDAPAVKGNIRTICRLCGTFIGYRPVERATK